MMAGIIVVEGVYIHIIKRTYIKPSVIFPGVIFYNWYQVRKGVADLFKAHPRNELLDISRQYQPRNFSLSMGIRIALFTLYSVATLSSVALLIYVEYHFTNGHYSACIVFVANKVTSFPYMVDASRKLELSNRYTC